MRRLRRVVRCVWRILYRYMLVSFIFVRVVRRVCGVGCTGDIAQRVAGREVRGRGRLWERLLYTSYLILYTGRQWERLRSPRSARLAVCAGSLFYTSYLIL